MYGRVKVSKSFTDHGWYQVCDTIRDPDVVVSYGSVRNGCTVKSDYLNTSLDLLFTVEVPARVTE